MFYLIIAVIALILWTWFAMWNGWNPKGETPFSWFEWWEYLLGILTGGVILAAASLAIMVTLSAVWHNAPVEETNFQSTNLLALQDNAGIQGTFFLGSGVVNNQLNYYYITEDTYGYHMDKVSSEDAYIRYTERAAYVEYIDLVFAQEWRNWFTSPWDSHITIFNVPQGTILENYQVDLK